MKRKLIKQGGGGGLTLYLPKKWIDKNHLAGGDEVNVEEESNRIVIDTKAKQKFLKQEVVLEESSPYFTQRLITNIYKKGVDELKLRFKQNMQRETINNTLNNLTIGYEVTDSTKNSCTIKSFTHEDQENIPITARKGFLLIKLYNKNN